MIKAVIFDCDGVLVESEVIAHEVELEVLSAIGMHYDRHDFAIRFMGLSDKAFWAALDADGQSWKLEGEFRAKRKHSAFSS